MKHTRDDGVGVHGKGIGNLPGGWNKQEIAGKYNLSEGLGMTITNLAYEEKELKEIVYLIDGKTMVKNRAAKKEKLLSFYVGGGAGISNMKFSGHTTYLENIAFDQIVVPYANVGMDVTGLRGIRRVGLRLEAGFNKAAYHASLPVYLVKSLSGLMIRMQRTR